MIYSIFYIVTRDTIRYMYNKKIIFKVQKDVSRIKIWLMLIYMRTLCIHVEENQYGN